MGRARMTNRLEALEVWAAALIEQLEPASRNILVRSLGQILRRSQQRRIIAQRNPGGSKFMPRKRRDLRSKKGRTKRKIQMFQKLRTARFLKIHNYRATISIGFNGRIARITRVHQYGLNDRAEPGASKLRYEQRQVLGLTDADLDLIRDGLLSHLNPQLRPV